MHIPSWSEINSPEVIWCKLNYYILEIEILKRIVILYNKLYIVT